MNKFEDVDVIASLEAIMKQNTAFYQNDFDLDRNILQKAAASPTAEDRRLLWFSRPSGTSCFRERDVFLKGTRQHNTWRFYGEQTRDKVLAYAVELTGIVNGKSKAISMSLTIRSISGTLRNRHYPQIITRCSMSMENGCSPPDSILTAIPTRSLGSLNALKRSLMTRKHCIFSCGRKSAAMTA